MRRQLCWMSVVLLIAGNLSCDTPTEGCLDFNAVGVDVTADEACDDCCVYPRLSLNFFFGLTDADTLTSTSSTNLPVLVDPDTLTVAGLSFYLTDVRLEYADGSVVAVTDTFSYRPMEGAALTAGPTEGLWRYTLNSPGSQEIGELTQVGELVALRAKFGLPVTLVSVVPELQFSTSALASDRDSITVKSDTLLRAGGIRFTVSPSGGGVRSDTLFIQADEAVSEIVWPLRDTLDLARATNLQLDIAVDPRDVLRLPVQNDLAGETFANELLARGSIVATILSR